MPVANDTHAAALDATMPQLTAASASWMKSREEISRRRQRVAVVFMVIIFFESPRQLRLCSWEYYELMFLVVVGVGVMLRFI